MIVSDIVGQTKVSKVVNMYYKGVMVGLSKD